MTICLEFCISSSFGKSFHVCVSKRIVWKFPKHFHVGELKGLGFWIFLKKDSGVWNFFHKKGGAGKIGSSKKGGITNWH